MIQLWSLTVDSGWLPGGPLLREGGGTWPTRWDIITPCNLEEIHWAAHILNESLPLVLSLCTATKLCCFQKPQMRGWENQFCLVGVPQGFVLGPSQISFSPGAMFSPKGVAAQTVRLPSCGIRPGAASQHTTLLRSSFVESELSGAYAEGFTCILLSVFLYVTPCHVPFPLSLPFNISIEGKEAKHSKTSHPTVPFCHIMLEKRALNNQFFLNNMTGLFG